MHPPAPLIPPTPTWLPPAPPAPLLPPLASNTWPPLPSGMPRPDWLVQANPPRLTMTSDWTAADTLSIGISLFLAPRTKSKQWADPNADRWVEISSSSRGDAFPWHQISVADRFAGTGNV